MVLTWVFVGLLAVSFGICGGIVAGAIAGYFAGVFANKAINRWRDEEKGYFHERLEKLEYQVFTDKQRNYANRGVQARQEAEGEMAEAMLEAKQVLENKEIAEGDKIKALGAVIMKHPKVAAKLARQFGIKLF